MSRIVSTSTLNVIGPVPLKYMLNTTPVRAAPRDSAPPCHTSSECVIIKQTVTPAHTGLMKLTNSLIAHRILYSERVKNIFSSFVSWNWNKSVQDEAVNKCDCSQDAFVEWGLKEITKLVTNKRRLCETQTWGQCSPIAAELLCRLANGRHDSTNKPSINSVLYSSPTQVTRFLAAARWCSLSETSWAALEPTEPTVHCVPEATFGGKAAGVFGLHSPPSTAEFNP